METTGLKPTDHEYGGVVAHSSMNQRMVEAIRRCWLGMVTMQSNFARENAAVLAACASEGFVTNRILTGVYVNQWVPTPIGLEFVQEMSGELLF